MEESIGKILAKVAEPHADLDNSIWTEFAQVTNCLMLRHLAENN